MRVKKIGELVKTYKVAIIGLGRMGSTIDDEHPALGPYSLPACCQASDRLELVAGSDLHQDRREAFGKKWGITALYEDYLEMIEHERPDMVAITTRGTSLLKPNNSAPSTDFREDSHAEIGAAVAETGVPMIYLEKAIANTVRGADTLLEVCLSNGTVFNAGVLRRFSSWAQVTRAAIKRGDIGEPRVVVHYGGSVLMHNHVHSIDTVSYLLGDPEIVAVRGELHPRDMKIEDNHLAEDPRATFHIQFENGVEAYSVPGGPVETEVIGSENSIRASNTLNRKEVAVHLRASVKGNEKPDWTSIPVPDLPGGTVVACLEDLVESHESGRPSKANVKVSHRVAEALLTVPESHRQGGAWIQLPVENRDLYVFHV